MSKFINKKLIYLFSNEKNKLISDEIMRNYRVISIKLRDYFTINLMSNSLNDIIKE